MDFRAQVVGWPPVRSYRKNMMAQKNTSEEGEKASSAGAAFVKVCMDGAPYLRKVDLKMYKSYQELSDALAKMFSSFTMGESSNVAYRRNIENMIFILFFLGRKQDYKNLWII